MQNVKEKFSKRMKADLTASYATALKDDDFKKVVNNAHIKDDVGMKYTSGIESCVSELRNCKHCKGLFACKNEAVGFINYPYVKDNRIVFALTPCKYKKEADKNLLEKENENKNKTSLKDIYTDDKNRVKALKWIKTFYDKYDIYKPLKGIYLHGSFGSGKTYLLSALLNELGKKGIKSEIIYYPELLRNLKDDFDTYASKVDYLCDVDILFLDDIGAEKVSSWGRDEVLGTILQSRMNNKKTTFFTSNLTIDELEEHLSFENNSMDKVKARRIIERIKQLTDDVSLISKNLR